MKIAICLSKEKLSKLGVMILLFTIFVIAACSGPEVKQNNAHRIVSLGGAISETLVALDLLPNIVGRDVTSVFPEDLLEVQDLGHHSQIKLETLLALNPSVVVTTLGFLSDELRIQIRKYGIDLIEFQQDYTLASTAKMIDSLGSLFGRSETAQTLVARLPESRTENEDGPRVIFIYARGAGALNIAGENTFASSLIRMAGGQPAVTDFEGFRSLTPEALAAANPDYLLFFNTGYASLGGEEGILKIPGIKETNAGKNRAFLTMDAALLNNFGPRLGQAVDQLHSMLQGQ